MLLPNSTVIKLILLNSIVASVGQILFYQFTVLPFWLACAIPPFLIAALNYVIVRHIETELLHYVISAYAGFVISLFVLFVIVYDFTANEEIGEITSFFDFLYFIFSCFIQGLILYIFHIILAILYKKNSY